MKKIQKERVSYYDVYVANDGTEFSTQEECKKYDDSALGVVRARYKKLVVKSGVESDICGVGSDECVVDVLRIKSKGDADIVMQRFMLENLWLKNDSNNDAFMRAAKKVSLALAEDDYLLVGLGCCDDCFWIIDTALNIKNRIDVFVTPDEKKD